MNIFVIPSWYPSSTQPISGVFVKEEVECLAELHPELSIVVSLDGAGDYFIDPRRPVDSLRAFRRYLSADRISITGRRPNLIEMTRPCLSWTPRVLNGNIGRLVEVHRRNFLKAMKDFGKPDLIHAHVTYPAGWIAMEIAREFNVPYLIKECMGPFPFNTPKFINADGTLTRWIREPLQNARLSIAMSPMLADSMRDFGFKRPLVIPYPVDDRRFFPAADAPTEKFHFFTLCRLSEEKGIPDLLRAISLAAREVPALAFKIGGGGKQFEYMQLARSLGIDGMVEWLGPVSREDAPQYFSACSAFVMVSHLETFGMVYAEAIASGKPVIATRCGGAEFIINEKNGILVEVGNVGQIAKAIVEMYRNHEKYDREEIRRDFMTRFSRGAVIEQIAHCYEKIMVDSPCAE